MKYKLMSKSKQTSDNKNVLTTVLKPFEKTCHKNLECASRNLGLFVIDWK